MKYKQFFIAILLLMWEVFFIDISKVFDKVWHNFLAFNLKSFKVLRLSFFPYSIFKMANEEFV